jgi:hypothetical protein
MEKSGKVGAPNRATKTLANFVDLIIKAATPGRTHLGESSAIEIMKYASRTGMIVWIAFYLVYALRFGP